MNALKDYLGSRRSSLSLSLEAPGPSADDLQSIVTIASRVPDHGKLAPWRFELWPEEQRKVMHDQLISVLTSDPVPEDVEKLRKGTDKLLHAPCVLAVISTATDHPKIPLWEQHLSVGAACMKTLMAANALGFEAQWLTAWYVYDDRARDILRLKPHERIAGIIHIGTSTTPKSERPRPDLGDIFSIRNT